MAVRPKDRFEVFKRDGFTCQYCGRKAPDVVLEVDHIVPQCEDGSDGLENLVTSCWDCNRGKAGRPLGKQLPVRDLKEQAELIHEREAQLRAYNEVVRAQRERKEAEFFEVWNHWFDVWHAETLDRYHTPWRQTLTHYIGRLGAQEVMDAMDVTGRRFDYVTCDAVRYFHGVLKHKAEDLAL